MLKVLLLFVLLIAGIVVGPMIAGHQGYVLIQTAADLPHRRTHPWVVCRT